jgi:type III restriction enzyme
LNTAHFYIRVDKRGVFSDILDKVNRKLATDAPGIKIVETKPGKTKPVPVQAKEERMIFETAYITDQAIEPIAEIIDSLVDYRNDPGSNIQSAGGRTLIQRRVDDNSEVEFEWEEFEHTNRVVARWLFQREVVRRFQGALGVAQTDAPKFDALVGFGSRAHKQIETIAERVVNSYVDNVFLKQKKVDEYLVGPTLVRREDMEPFTNALHEGYSGLNDLERDFAHAIDKTGLTWCRNPSRSGYSIPLISLGPTRNFYPDFLVWKKKDVFAIDTTGGHLLSDKTAYKLLSIAPATQGGGRLIVRLVSPGKWNAKLEQEDSVGYTIWSRRQDGSLRPSHVETVTAAIERAVTRDPA